MKILKTTLLLFFTAVALIFVLQNLNSVSLSFLTWNAQIPLSIAIAVFYILGAVSGGLMFSLLKKLAHKNKNSKT